MIFQGSERRLVQVLADGTELVLHLEATPEFADVRAGDEVWTVVADADAAYVMAGTSAIVGATTTDVDEVQAALDGKARTDDAGGDRADRSRSAGSTAGPC